MSSSCVRIWSNLTAPACRCTTRWPTCAILPTRRNYATCFTGVYEAVKTAPWLSKALAAYPRIFNEVFTGLIAAGEKNRQPSESFLHLAEHLKWSSEIRRKVKKHALSDCARPCPERRHLGADDFSSCPSSSTSSFRRLFHSLAYKGADRRILRIPELLVYYPWHAGGADYRLHRQLSRLRGFRLPVDAIMLRMPFLRPGDPQDRHGAL